MRRLHLPLHKINPLLTRSSSEVDSSPASEFPFARGHNLRSQFSGHLQIRALPGALLLNIAVEQTVSELSTFSIKELETLVCLQETHSDFEVV